jgi:hypothetical protein
VFASEVVTDPANLHDAAPPRRSTGPALIFIMLVVVKQRFIVRYTAPAPSSPPPVVDPLNAVVVVRFGAQNRRSQHH